MPIKLDLNKYRLTNSMYKVWIFKISLKTTSSRSHPIVFRVWLFGILLEHESRWVYHQISTHISVWLMYLFFLSWLHHFSSVQHRIIFNLEHFQPVRNRFLTVRWWSIIPSTLLFSEVINANLERTINKTKYTDSHVTKSSALVVKQGNSFIFHF